MPISPSDRTLGDLLVGRRLITTAQLDEAVTFAEASPLPELSELLTDVYVKYP